jgi:hypothetical protein
MENAESVTAPAEGHIHYVSLPWEVGSLRTGYKLALVASTLLTACKGENNAAPRADDAEFIAREDELVNGQHAGSDPEGRPLTFRVVSAQRGRVTSLSSDGAFTFEPEADFYGAASFVFSVNDDHGQIARATVSILLENVNDPPQLVSVPNLTNSPETQVLRYQLTVVDPDPDSDELSFSISAQNPSIVEASVDPSQGQISLRALRVGTTTVEVSVADTEYTSTRKFTFSAEEVTKGRVLRHAEATTGAVVLRNEADQPVDFVLEHNGFPVFENVESVAEYVRAMPPAFDGEPFERKLWRFLRDSVYHDVPLNNERVHYDPWVTLNSLGWGFCSHVAGAYVLIAQAAGYEARVWGLDGHVVPEIRVDGQWRMYDPDLAVYYKTADGRIAGVEELAASPTLITAPIDPIFVGSWWQFPYSQTLAGWYSSTADNYNAVNVFLPAHQTPSARIVLPPGATLTYPGRWTDAPTGVDGTTPYDVRAYRQALLQVQPGWTGELRLPWMAWEIAGAGQVGIDDEVFAVGSPELTERLRSTQVPITSLRIYSSSELRIVLFVNVVRFDIRPRTIIEIRGLDVWGIDVKATTLERNVGGGAPLDDSLLKPLPQAQ